MRADIEARPVGTWGFIAGVGRRLVRGSPGNDAQQPKRKGNQPKSHGGVPSLILVQSFTDYGDSEGYVSWRLDGSLAGAV
jgi:hypothetical protein